MIAGTLAAHGVCPTTAEKVFSVVSVEKCLAIMLSCGMYDASGTWIFDVGLPAKSGVSGFIYVIFPGRFGLAIWAPPLGKEGNSVRGVEFVTRLIHRLQLHPFGVSCQEAGLLFRNTKTHKLVQEAMLGQR